jgi:hypothetical protein
MVTIEAEITAFQELFITVVGGAIGGVIVYYFTVGQDNWFKRIKVKRILNQRHERILNQRHEEVSGLLELYEELFPDDGNNYTANEVLEFFADGNGSNRKTHVKTEDYFLVATIKKTVIGFLFCHYYPEVRSGIVSYLGIKKESEEARTNAVAALLKKLMEFLCNRSAPCDLLVFELQKIERITGKKQRGIGRMAAFRKRALDFNSKAYEICIDYKRPKLSLDPKLKEEPLILAYVPLGSHTPLNSLSKSSVIKLLEFIHLYCYADFYEVSDPQFIQFQEYLKKRLASYEKNLPDMVPVVSK